jgi:transcriptional regulator of acetoin/glycerol metabolism
MWNIFREMISVIYRNCCVSENALFYFFDSDLRAFKSLTQNYKTIENLNILFFYGDQDWNPVEAAFDVGFQ